jgi:hypothetical protein
MAYVGHLGNHSLAQKLEQKTGEPHTVPDAIEALGHMGMAACDPAPWNGAFSYGHKLLTLFGWAWDGDRRVKE